MNRLKQKAWAAGLLIFFFCSCTQPSKQQPPAVEDDFYEPWEVLGSLFHDVQMEAVFQDSKTFVDCVPKKAPEEILQDYLERKDLPGFKLDAFVEKNFEIPSPAGKVPFRSGEPFAEHLEEHWHYLTRQSVEVEGPTTLISLPYPYIVPGGRFREVYYWDSYFSMIGLGASGQTELVRSMVDNFAFLIDSIGFIPNGNRTYYLGRSQPPYFSVMVELLMELAGDDTALNYLSQIQKEYDFWMAGADRLTDSVPAISRVVRLPDSTVLNRYWDHFDFPRPEAYKPDVELARGLPEKAKKVLYRNLRAAAESGWDFSTRWFEDKNDFASIRTVDILPVDLNCLMYNMERMLAKLYTLEGNLDQAKMYSALAERRKAAIHNYFWSSEQQAFTDYWWKKQGRSRQLTLAGAYPLYFKVATEEQAAHQAKILEKKFLEPGGLVTTTITSGHQWDFPNGWAPMQWIAIKGLEHYHKNALADEIEERWLSVNREVYENTGKMMEKYNVADTSLIAGGGEYPTQDGFGWTNGVALGLMEEVPAY